MKDAKLKQHILAQIKEEVLRMSTFQFYVKVLYIGTENKKILLHSMQIGRKKREEVESELNQYLNARA